MAIRMLYGREQHIVAFVIKTTLTETTHYYISF